MAVLNEKANDAPMASAMFLGSLQNMVGGFNLPKTMSPTLLVASKITATPISTETLSDVNRNDIGLHALTACPVSVEPKAVANALIIMSSALRGDILILKHIFFICFDRETSNIKIG